MTGGGSARSRNIRRRSVRISGCYCCYCYYLLLVLLFSLLLFNLFPEILYFIVVVINYRHTSINFGTVIPVTTAISSMTAMPSMKSAIQIILTTKRTIF